MGRFTHLHESHPGESSVVLRELDAGLQLQRLKVERPRFRLRGRDQRFANPASVQVWPHGKLTDVERIFPGPQGHATDESAPSSASSSVPVAAAAAIDCGVNRSADEGGSMRPSM